MTILYIQLNLRLVHAPAIGFFRTPELRTALNACLKHGAESFEPSYFPLGTRASYA